jgi:predicted GTPase
VTRDRNFAPAAWRGTPFVLVDTGGIDLSEREGVVGRVQGAQRLVGQDRERVGQVPVGAGGHPGVGA